MGEDRDIANAIKAGERNRDVSELVHNWCTHARVEKFGGVGLVEMQTGLPIGHHSMACDHASARGIAAWDLADAALDFHDRNCVGCKFRNPRRLPNLTQLVRERDDARQRAALARKQHEDERERAFAQRQSRRSDLKSQVAAGSVTILEQLEELDRDPTAAGREQLCQTARLAPEIFSTHIVEYLFSSLEAGEGWLTEAGLRTLHILNADPARLTRVALAALARGFTGSKEAGDVLVSHTLVVDPALIAPALPTLVLLARPPHSVFGDGGPRTPVLEPLVALYRAQPKAVREGINTLLSDRKPWALRAGANAIAVIHEQDDKIAPQFARSIAAVLTRAETVVDFDEDLGRSEVNELYHDLQHALTLALDASPASTDVIVASYLRGSRPEAQARIVRSYSRLFRVSFREEPVQEAAAHTVALKRLLEIAAAAEDFEVLSEVLGVFRGYTPRGLADLVRRELTHLIGTAVLMDVRQSSVEAEANTETNWLASMEKRNLASAISQIQKSLIGWVARAAAESASARAAYMEILQGLPAAQEGVRAIMVTALSSLMVTAEGLNAALPSLYTALVGPSQRLRAAALEAFSEIDRLHQEALPDLLFEAFVVSLQDSYVIVHQTAIRSLESFDLPKTFHPSIKAHIRNLILAYSHNRESHADAFLMTCIWLYASRYATTDELAGDFGAMLVEQMGQFEPYVVVQKLGWLHKKLAKAPGFAALAIKLLASSRNDSLDDQTVRTLRSLSASAIQAERETLAGIARQVSANRDLIGVVVELLTASGAWQEAASAAEVAVEAIPDTTSNKPQRLFMDLLRIAAAYEKALALGSIEVLPILESQWQLTLEAIEQDRKEHEKRRNLFPGFSSSD